jgi:hypothetical protein
MMTHLAILLFPMPRVNVCIILDQHMYMFRADTPHSELKHGDMIKPPCLRGAASMWQVVHDLCGKSPFSSTQCQGYYHSHIFEVFTLNLEFRMESTGFRQIP